MFTSLLLTLLNKEASSRKSKADEIIGHLGIKDGAAIADIGSGGGYFTLLFAGRTGNAGTVYAVDVKPDHLEFLRRSAGRAGIQNVRYILAGEGELDLPRAGLDLVFARNVYHHLPAPGDYFRTLKKFLKPDGLVAIIEHTPKSGFGFVTLFKHTTSRTTIVADMEKAGYVAVKSFDFLPRQSFILFGPALLLAGSVGHQ